MKKKLITTTHTPTETEKLGYKIGKTLQGSEIIELISDIGGGKTTLVRGIVSGAGSQDAVASPTFTISKTYKANRLTLVHFDFYRLQDPGIISNELEEYLQEKDTAVLIEWPKIINDFLPQKKLRISIEAIDENVRKFHFECPKQLEYIIKELV